MTDKEWAECTDPERMLVSVEGRASDRKLRLFACACVRTVWHLLKEECSRTAVEVAERYADGLATSTELASAYGAALTAAADLARAAEDAADAAFTLADEGADPAAVQSAEWEADTCAYAADLAAHAARAAHATEPWCAARSADEAEQCAVLRDIFGNLHCSLTTDPARPTWNGGSVAEMARVIYTERRFDGLPNLAGLLEAAGCTDADLLDHCHGHGSHVRGCWVLDLILGKE